MKILVADDDASFVAAQSAILRQHGYSVISCVHGAEVMPTVEQERPDVVLLDLAMPGMSGFDIAWELAAYPEVRPRLLIAVTGYDHPDAKQMTASAGFDYHFDKPVNYSALTALLDSIVQMV